MPVVGVKLWVVKGQVQFKCLVGEQGAYGDPLPTQRGAGKAFLEEVANRDLREKQGHPCWVWGRVVRRLLQAQGQEWRGAGRRGGQGGSSQSGG